MPHRVATDESVRVLGTVDGNSPPRLLAQPHRCPRDVLERVDKVLDENLTERLDGRNTALFGERINRVPHRISRNDQAIVSSEVRRIKIAVELDVGRQFNN